MIAGASLSGGLASATSTWIAALALTLLTQMLLIIGLSSAMQYIVFGIAIIAGMVVSGDRVAAVLAWGLRGRRADCSTGRRRVGAAKGHTPQKNVNDEPTEGVTDEKEAPDPRGAACRDCGSDRADRGREWHRWRGTLDRIRPLGYVGKGGARSGGGGFGETYSAPSTTLAHTLFKANLLPANKTARNISLAAFGRSPKTVNYALALKCWKNNGCSTGTGGKLTVAYVEGFGENTYRQMSKMEFILQALTYPQIGKIIYMSAHSDLNQAIADFKSVIAQHVSAIVTYPDFGDAMIPCSSRRPKAGFPSSTYAWGYVTGPG